MKDNKLNPVGELKTQLNIPKTETRIILNDWQLESKKSKLSPAARAKVANHNKPYQSQSQEGYGPCYAHFYNTDGCDCNFSITAILICVNGVSKSEKLVSTDYNEYQNLLSRIAFEKGVWAPEWKTRLEDCFVPSGRARKELAEGIEKAGPRCGPQIVAVTDKEEWVCERR